MRKYIPGAVLILVFFVSVPLAEAQRRTAGTKQQPPKTEKAPDPAIAFFEEGLKCEPSDHECRVSNFTKAVNLNLNTAAVYKERAASYLALGETAKSISDLARALKVDPNDSASYLAAARALKSLTETDAAIEALSKAAEIDPKNPEIFKHRASLHFLAGNNARAAEDLSKAIALLPGDAALLESRAEIWEADGNFENAVADYASLAAAADDPVPYLLRRASLNRVIGKSEEAFRDLSQAISVKPDSMPALTARASEYERSSKYDLALADLERASLLLPTDASLLAAQARVLNRMGRRQESWKAIERSLSVDPESVDALLEKGRIRLDEYWRPDRAIADFGAVLEIEMDNIEALAGRATAYVRKGEYQKAVEDLRTLSETGYGESFGQELQVAWECGRYGWENSFSAPTSKCLHAKRRWYEYEIQEMEDRLIKDPKDAQAYYRRALALMWVDWTGNSSRILKDLEKAVETDPLSARAWAALGQFHFSQALTSRDPAGFNKGMDFFQRAIELGPDDPGLLIGLGTHLSFSGRKKEAIQTLEKAATRFPGSAEVQLFLGLYHSEQKDHPRAAAAFKRSFELGRKDALKFLLSEYRDMKRPDLLLDAFESALSNLPDSAEVYAARAHASTDDARIADLRKALEMDPTNPFRYTELATWLGIGFLKNTQERLDLLGKAISLEPDIADFYFKRALIFKYEMNDAAKAAADINKAVELDPARADSYRGVLK